MNLRKLIMMKSQGIPFYTLLLIFINVGTLRAQGITWQAAWSLTDAATYTVTDVHMDSTFGIYVTGYFDDSPAMSAGQDQVFFIAKYNNQGSLSFLKTYGETGVLGKGTYPQAIVSDASNNIYVAGYFNTDNLEIGTLTSKTNAGGGNDNMFVAKFNLGGDPVWSLASEGIYGERINDMSIDSQGDLVITGYTNQPSFPFLGHTHSNTVVGMDGFLAKIDTDGNRIWSVVDDGNTTSEIHFNQLAIGPNDEVYLTGKFSGTSVPFENKTTSSQGGYDMFISMYDTDGVVQWMDNFGSSGGSEEGTSLAVDTSGYVYLAGSYQSSFYRGVDYFDNRGGKDILLIKYGSGGSTEWTQKVHSNQDESIAGLAVSSDDRLIMAGTFRTNLDFGTLSLVASSPVRDQVFVSLYDLDGNAVGVNSYGATTSAIPVSAVTSRDKSIFMSGNFQGSSISFNGQVASYTADQDAFMTYGLVNFAPTLVQLSSTTAPENEVDTLVGKFITYDQDDDDTHTYELIAGTGDTDNSYFTISNDSLFVGGSALNYEVDNSLEIRVRVTDAAGSYYDQQFVISVSDNNDTPSDLSLNKRHLEEGFFGFIEISAEDEDAEDSFTYSLVTGTGDTDNSFFKIEGDSIIPLGRFDFEEKQSYTIRVQVTDAAGAIYEEAFGLDIYDALTTYPELYNEYILQDVPSEFEINDFTVDGNGELLVIGAATGNWNLNDSVMNSGSYVMRVSDSIVALDRHFAGAKDFITAGQIGNDQIYFSSLFGNFVARYNEDSTRNEQSYEIGLVQRKGLLDAQGNAIVAYYGSIPSVIKIKKYDLVTQGQYYVPATTIYELPSTNGPVFKDMEVDALGNVYLTYYEYYNAIIHLVKLDNDGNVIWDNSYPRTTGSGNIWIENIHLDGDKIEATGTSNNATTIVNIGGTLINAQPFYFEVDTSGTTYYTVNNSEVLYDVRIGDKYYNPISDNGTVVLQEIALDKSALTLIEHTTSLTGTVEQFKATPDGELIVRGVKTKQNTVSSTATAYVARLDLTGSTLFYKEIDEVVYDEGNITALWTNKTDRVLLGGWSDKVLTWDNVDIGPGYFIIDINATGVVTNSYSMDHPVEQIALTSTGEIYVTDEDNVYQLDNSFTQLWSGAITSPALKLLVDSNDDVYVVQDKINGDFTQGKVEKFLSDGTPSWSVLSDNSFYTWFFGDAELLEDSLLLLERVNDQVNLLVYDENGNLDRSANFKVGNGSSGARSIAVSANNEIYLEKENDYETSSILVMDRFFNQIDSLVTEVQGEIMIDNSGKIFLSKTPVFDASYQFHPPYQNVPEGAYWDFLGDRMIVAGRMSYKFLGENQAPEAISLSKLSVPENDNNGFVGKFVIDDSDDTSDFTYRIGRWRTDYEYFEYESGANNFVGFQAVNDSLFTYLSFDFEEASTELLRIKVTDPRGGHYTKDFEIVIEDANDSITNIELDTVYLSEALPQGTVISSFAVTDEDAVDSFTIELVSGEGDNLNEFFEIVDNQLVTSATELDNEIHHAAGRGTTGTPYGNAFSDSLRVRATDAGGLSFEKYLVVYVLDSNELATEIRLEMTSTDENLILVGAIRTDDPEDVLLEEQSWLDQTRDDYTYSLVTGEGDDDNSSFYLSGNIELRSNGSPDYESDSIYSVRIRADHDHSDFFLEQSFEIKVTDVNTAPTGIQIFGDRDKTISANQIDEYIDSGIFIGILFAVDSEDPQDEHLFTCADPNFELRVDSLFTAMDLDLSDYTSAYQLSITVDDQKGGVLNDVVGLNINNINNAPTFINMNGVDVINENELLTGNSFAAIDNMPSGDTHTYELVSGEGDSDNDKFLIEGSALSSTQTFNYEEVTTASIRVRATDSYGESVEQAFVFTIANVNEAPFNIAMDNQSVEENLPVGTVVGMLSAEDEDVGDQISFQFENGGANDHFEIFSSGQDYFIRTRQVFDYESQSSYLINIAAISGNVFSDLVEFEILIVDVDDGVELSATSFDENTEIGSAVATFSSPSGSMTYTFASGEGDQDNGLFSIDGDQLLVTSTISFEDKNVLNILVAGTPDGGGQATTQQFVLSVNDINEAPFSMNLNGLTIEENLPIGAVVGSLSAEDEDADEQFTYSVAGSDFAINGDQLVSSRMFDFGMETSLNVTITVEDKGGLTLDQSFSIEIINDPSDDDDEVLGLTDSEVIIYPIPTHDYLYFKSEHDYAEYQIRDLAGRLMMAGKLRKKLDVRDLKPGVYLLHVKSGSISSSHTIIKE